MVPAAEAAVASTVALTATPSCGNPRSGRLARRLLAALRREARRRAEALKLRVAQQRVKSDVRAVGCGGGAQARGPRLKKTDRITRTNLKKFSSATSRNLAPPLTRSAYAFSPS